MNLDFNPNDICVINRINADHANARDNQARFIYSGQYRELLSGIFKATRKPKTLNPGSERGTEMSVE